MRKYLLSLLIACSVFQSYACQLSDTSSLAKIVQESFKNSPFEGGRIVKVNNRNYVISLAIVNSNSTNDLITLNRVGTTKARRNLLVFLEGSEIASSKILLTIETITQEDQQSIDSFKEEIKETAMGFVQGTEDLCSWSDNDKKEFIKVIFKEFSKAHE